MSKRRRYSVVVENYGGEPRVVAETKSWKEAREMCEEYYRSKRSPFDPWPDIKCYIQDNTDDTCRQIV